MASNGALPELGAGLVYAALGGFLAGALIALIYNAFDFVES